MTVFVKLLDRDNNIHELDGGEYFINVSRSHHEVHVGRHYTMQSYDGDVDIASPKQYLFVTPDSDLRAHFLPSIATGAGGVARIYEGVTTSADGTELTPRNSNRNFADASAVSCYEDPTVTDPGTLLCPTVIGGPGGSGPFPAASPGAASREDEWVLAPNTKYMIEFTPFADDTAVSLCAGWYEV